MIGEIILCTAIFLVAFTLYGCAVADSLDDYDKDEPEDLYAIEDAVRAFKEMKDDNSSEDLSDAKPYVEEKKDGKHD